FDEVDLGYKVGLIKAHAGLDGTFFDALTEEDYHGLVLEALGQGNIPPSALSGLQKVLDHGIDVVLVSRSFNGIVGSYYDYEGGGHELSGRRVISSSVSRCQKFRFKHLSA